MKRKLLCLISCLLPFCGTPQVVLTGSGYYQDFNRLGDGLPSGWEVYTGASPGAPGQAETYPAVAAAWTAASSGFKNFASGAAIPLNSTAAEQHSCPDRALGIRQGGSGGYDPGAAFVFKIAETEGLTDFVLQFSFLCLSRESRNAEWIVDYGLGDTPQIFHPVPGFITLTTGNDSVFCDTSEVVFGNLLDNYSGTVWIRIVQLSASSGSGRRPATAIDDFRLSWQGNAPGPLNPSVIATSPPSGALFVLGGTVPSISFNRRVSKGAQGNFYIVNEHLQTTDTIPVQDSGVRLDGSTVSLHPFRSEPATSYHILFDSSCFDTAGYLCTGMYMQTDWYFTTAPPVTTLRELHETFDASCDDDQLPSGWQAISRSGAQKWSCHTAYNIASLRISAYSGGKFHSNDDWLITPRLDPVQEGDLRLYFMYYRKRQGPEPQLLISGDYPGYGDPDTFTWRNIPVPFHDADSSKWTGLSTEIPRGGGPFFLAFRYTSSDSSGYEVRIDSVVLAGIPASVYPDAAPFILPAPAITVRERTLDLRYDLPAGTNCRVMLTTLTGNHVGEWTFHAAGGAEKRELPIPGITPGMYLVRFGYGAHAIVCRIWVPG